MVRHERRKAAALGRKKKRTATAATPSALANAEHQLEAGLAVASHKHDRQHVHAAQAPPRPLRTKAAQAERFVGVLPACFTISTFCISHNLSEGLFFKLKKQGRTPKEMHVNGRVLITFEAAAEWRARMERETAPAAAAWLTAMEEETAS